VLFRIPPVALDLRIAVFLLIMAKAPATIQGYPQAARVIQAPTMQAPMMQPRIQGATIQSGQVMQARTVGTASPTIISGQPRVMTSPQPMTISGGISSGGVRQAKVISAGSPISSGTIQPTMVTQGATRMVAGSNIVSSAPRIVQAGTVRPATVIQAGQSTGLNVYSQSANTQSAYEVKHQDDPQLQNLKELRKSCGLKNVPVNDCLQVLKGAAIDGKLTLDQFMVAYVQVLQQFQVEAPSVEVCNAVFDLFDRDDNGVVDMMELICGASLLCTGTEEEKIHAVFNVFDENGDGVISMDEMFKFLTSVFKVVLTPNVMAVMNTMGVTVESPEDLASVTALECFKTADLNHDGRLSVTEFKNWFFAPRNDPSFLFSPVRKLLQ